MFAIAFLFVCELCDCFKSRRLEAEILVLRHQRRAMGIRDRPTSFRSPSQNGYAERLIGPVRRECTDHLIAFNAEHLRRILAKYAIYYNEVRRMFRWEGRALHTPDRAVRRRCCASGPWRPTSSVRSNRFRKRQATSRAEPFLA